MKNFSNEIIRAMPLDLVNDFRRKALCLMSDLMEDLEMKYGSLTEEEINFFKVLQSIQGDQERFDGLFSAFGKLLYAHQAIEREVSNSISQSRIHGCMTDDSNDCPF